MQQALGEIADRSIGAIEGNPVRPTLATSSARIS
jgi:hypothetical protein